MSVYDNSPCCGSIWNVVHTNGDPNSLAGDPATNTVYATLQGLANRVEVIRGATDTITATVPVGTNPLGVAVDPVTGMVFVTDSGSGTVSAF